MLIRLFAVCVLASLGWIPVMAADLPVAVVSGDQATGQSLMEDGLSPAGIDASPIVGPDGLPVADYGSYSAVIFLSGGSPENAWNAPGNKEAVMEWLSQGGVAVIMGFLSFPKMDTDKAERGNIANLEEFLGFSSVTEKAAGAQGGVTIDDASDPVFALIPASERGKEFRWVDIGGKNSVSSRVINRIEAAVPLASAVGGGHLIASHSIGKGKVYFFGTVPYFNSDDGASESDYRAYLSVVAAAAKPRGR